ncbi:DUF4259 domain-containing protein [Thermicanus aegyptius]|uniref:DUF4259 domain-containing protein n=1 Tax=Thermicanus aegyptius TaxID=94009 RepID=UPI00042959B4|nr:DUF4259 domain-containing protein [Thermicanus aegyptius]
MGAWGYGIFDNDDVLDIRDLFRQLVREGLPMKEVTKRCVEDYPDPMNDVAVVLALAALQMEQKQLQPEIKRRALQMIEEKKDIATWNDPEKRKQALEAFRQKTDPLLAYLSEFERKEAVQKKTGIAAGEVFQIG